MNCKSEDPYLKVQKKCDFSVTPEKLSTNRSETTLNEWAEFLVGRYFFAPVRYTGVRGVRSLYVDVMCGCGKRHFGCPAEAESVLET